MKDLSAWLTIPEMAAATGKSIRSIERLITLHKITVAKRPVQGMKPVTVIPPEEAEKHRAVLLRPTVEPQADNLPIRQPDRLPTKATLHQPDTRAILKALEQLRVPLSQKVYLTVQEASSYLGFPQSEIKRLLNAGVIPSIRLSNGWRRIARKELDHYTPPAVGLTKWREEKEESTTRPLRRR
jgi:excisionase family DNA binding protein